LLEDGALVGWGANADGQLTFTNINSVASFSAGVSNTLVINATTIGPSPASAVAQVVNGFIVDIQVTDVGSGYVDAPHVRIVGSGAGATAVATLTNGVVASIHITSAGSGYSGNVVVQIDPPPQIPRTATAEAVLVNGFVVAVNVADPGLGYTNTPAVVFAGGGGSGASARAIVTNGQVVGIEVINSGVGYTSLPQVIIGSPFPVVQLGVRISKIAVDLGVVLGKRYDLQSSNDLIVWTSTASTFTAERESMTLEFSVDQTGKFFRLVQLP
jgi:hypothetical protein